MLKKRFFDIFNLVQSGAVFLNWRKMEHGSYFYVFFESKFNFNSISTHHGPKYSMKDTKLDNQPESRSRIFQGHQPKLKAKAVLYGGYTLGFDSTVFPSNSHQSRGTVNFTILHNQSSSFPKNDQ